MPMESLLSGNSPEECFSTLVGVSLAAAAAAARLRSQSHIDRDALRRAMRTLSVGMRIYR